MGNYRLSDNAEADLYRIWLSVANDVQRYLDQTEIAHGWEADYGQ